MYLSYYLFNIDHILANTCNLALNTDEIMERFVRTTNPDFSQTVTDYVLTLVARVTARTPHVYNNSTGGFHVH